MTARFVETMWTAGATFKKINTRSTADKNAIMDSQNHFLKHSVITELLVKYNVDSHST